MYKHNLQPSQFRGIFGILMLLDAFAGIFIVPWRCSSRVTMTGDSQRVSHKKCHLLYFDDISFVFHRNELNFLSNYSLFEALQNTLFLLSKIISIILRCALQSISLRLNFQRQLVDESLQVFDDQSIFRRDFIPIKSMSKFIPD